MIRNRLGRIATVLTAASTALMVLGIGTVTAAPPGWEFLKPKALPPVVAPGNDAGYSFTIHNGGKSNIAQLFLTTSVDGEPSYFFNSRGTTCQLSPELFCAFGALNAGESIDVVVAWSTVGSIGKFDVTFELNGTGNTFSDGDKQTSHGDTKTLDLSTNIVDNKNFTGGFTDTQETFSNVQDLGPKNIQAGSIQGPTGGVGVSYEDGLANNAFSCGAIAGCNNQFGEWARLFANEGQTFSGGFKVTLLVLGSKVPSGATVDTIDLIHVPTLADGSLGIPYVISTRCSATTLPTVVGGAECVTVTKVGQNFQIEGWLKSNGAGKGTF